MRLKPNYIYLIVIAFMVSVGYSYAQESVSPVLEGMESERVNNTMEYTDGEGSSQRVQSTTPVPYARDTVRTRTGVVKPKSATQQKVGEEQEKPEESVLGFNFLYYIFQKYKMSDIID